MLTGLFLGAGASCEAGMPLVWELTSALKSWLTPEKLRSLNEGWRSQGGCYPDDVIEELAKVLVHPDMHYESILGFLETQFRRNGSVQRQRDFHGLYAWLVEMVYWILHLRHINNVPFIERNVRGLDGIARLAEKNSPLWIFSLNHDVMIECLAAVHGIPLNSGFTKSTMTLLRRDASGRKIGELLAEVITQDELERTGMPYWQPGTQGINLLKIHGALDVFAFRDGKDLLKLLPKAGNVAGVIEALREANQELTAPSLPTKVTNEITYDDDGGTTQFLRRSLLAGAFKFDNPASQVLPMRLLDYFKSNINYVSKLICIGYGFGDVHINQVFRSWLEFSGDRQLEIVAPGMENVPTSFLHLVTQITLKDALATDYLDSLTGITRTRREVLEKNFAAWARRAGTAGKTEFAAYFKQLMDGRVVALARKIAALPRRDGDIDLAAVGLTPEEFVRQHSAELNADNFLEAFLSSRAPVAPPPASTPPSNP